MTKPKTITVDGEKYTRATEAPKGNRCVVVVDRGWIFAEPPYQNPLTKTLEGP